MLAASGWAVVRSWEITGGQRCTLPDVSWLKEYLNSPQFPDEEPPTAEEIARPGWSLHRITGGWVAAGEPRWKAYAIYLSSLIGGIAMAIPAPGDLDFFLFIGIALIAFGIFGIAETLRGKRFPRPG